MTRVRILAIAAFVAALVGVPTPAASARTTPHFSGRIVSGVLTTGPAMSCSAEPDCLPWLASGCQAELATRGRAAWLTAIVDVSSLADGTTPRTFAIQRGRSGRIIGGANFQFWTRDCEEVDWTSWHTFWECQSGETAYGYPCEKTYSANPALGVAVARATYPLPAEVAWMTISANDNVNITWSVA